MSPAAHALLRALGLIIIIQPAGFLFMIYYWILGLRIGAFVRKPSAEYASELALARDNLWNLSKQPFGLHHQFLSLRDGFRFHYVTNTIPASTSAATKPLVIFLHGFPDSWAVWRHVLGSTRLRESSNLVAVDLPGYGGSDLLKRYSTTDVLERLTELIIALRELYGIDGSTTAESQERVIIAGHDWGCVLAMRLASEAPQLADRFILTNGPLLQLVRSNVVRLVSSAVKMLKIFLRSPIQSRSMLGKVLHTLKPVFRQLKSSGYVFAFQLPRPLLRLQGSSGNCGFLRMVHAMAQGVQERASEKDIAEGVASALGPAAGSDATTTGTQYSDAVVRQGSAEKYVSMTHYYRHETSVGHWVKSIETITALYRIGRGNEIRRTSSHAGVFDEGPRGSLKTKATVLWGLKDFALDHQLSLDGIADYLAKESQVIVLPRAQHHTIVEKEGRIAVQRAIEWAVAGEQGDVGLVVKAAYTGATVTTRT